MRELIRKWDNAFVPEKFEGDETAKLRMKLFIHTNFAEIKDYKESLIMRLSIVQGEIAAHE